MRFGYYNDLSPSQQAIYRKSDRLAALPLPGVEELRPLVSRLKDALENEQAAGVRQAASGLCRAVCRALGVESVEVKVLSKRPNRSGEELMGTYSEREDRPAKIVLWMRTAKRKQVVALKTFLRTLLHELCHHLDYTLLKLDDSFHTQGFFRRESSLFSQLFSEPPRPRPEKKPAKAKKKKKVQMKLPL
jgi:hypothetical protein